SRGTATFAARHRPFRSPARDCVNLSGPPGFLTPRDVGALASARAGLGGIPPLTPGGRLRRPSRPSQPGTLAQSAREGTTSISPGGEGVDSRGNGTSGRMIRAAAAALTAALAGGSALAFEFDTGNPDVSIRWDNTVRYNVGVRVEGRDSKIGNSAVSDEGTYSFDKGD